MAADQRSLEYNQAQFDTGVGDYISVAEAKTTLEAAEATAVNVGLLRAQYEHAIAVLLGKMPSDFSIPVKPMVYTPPPIPTGVPSQLAERRPDIAAAERTLAEENAVIGIGYGAFFPQVTISASGGLQSALFKHLFDWPSRTWSVGPSISQVIFDGNLYRAELHQYVATYNADLANYRETVLTAFQQVEDSLAATRVYSQQILRQQQAVKDAQDYLDLELVRYNTGVDPYVDVVIAQSTLLNSQEALNAVEVNEMTSTVQLVQALGGGWDRTQLPTSATSGRQDDQRGLQTAAVSLLLRHAVTDVLAFEAVLGRTNVAAADHRLSGVELAARDQPHCPAARTRHDGHIRILRMAQFGLVLQHENRSRVHLFGDPLFKEMQVG